MLTCCMLLCDIDNYRHQRLVWANAPTSTALHVMFYCSTMQMVSTSISTSSRFQELSEPLNPACSAQSTLDKVR